MYTSRPRTPLTHALVTLLVALCAALGFVAVGAGPASAADGDVAWAIRTDANDFGAARQNFSHTLNPGGTIKDGIVVLNHSKKTLSLDIYAADGFTTDTGQLDLDKEGEKATGAGAWIHLDRSTVTIKAGKSVTVPFTISPPDNATPGDHMGGIVTSLTRPDAAQGINVDRRLAMRVRLRVGGELKPQLSVENLHVDYAGSANPFGKGDATMTYTVHNTGNAILTARQAASVSGPFGALRVSADKVADLPELLPGDTLKVSVPVDGVAPTLRSAGTVTLTPLLTDASGTVSPLEAVKTTTHGWAMPWTLLLVLLVVCALAVLAVRARRQAAAREDARVQEAIEQALRERETADQLLGPPR